MPPLRTLNRIELGRKGQSYVLIVQPCCAGRTLLSAYARQSSEDTEQEQRSIEGQIDDALEGAHKRDCCVNRVYVDDDITAAKRTLRRPAFEALLSELDKHSTPGVAMYHQDRYFRLNRDLERLLDVRVHHAFRFVTKSREYDLGNEDDIMVLQIVGVVGGREVAATSRRVSNKLFKNAQYGLRTGGPRAFGWNATPDAYHQMADVLNKVRALSPEAFYWVEHAKMKDALKIAEEIPALFVLLDDYKAARARVLRERKELKCPIESAHLRKARERLVNGTPRGKIVREWNISGVFGTRGGDWDVGGFTEMITSPLMVGYRTYKGEAAVDKDGNWIKGTQEPIFTEEEYTELLTVLPFKRRRSGWGTRPKTPHGNRKYLLSGLLICGACFKPMHGGPSKAVAARPAQDGKPARSARPARRLYKCDNSRCGKVAINAPKAEEAVRKLVAQFITNSPEAQDFSPETEAPWEGQEELAALEGARKFWADKMKAPGANLEFAFSQIQDLEEQISTLREHRAEWQRSLTVVPRPSVGDMRDLSALSDLEHQRAVLERYLRGVLVRPVTQHVGPKFDFGRLVPDWLTQRSQTSPEAAPV